MKNKRLAILLIITTIISACKPAAGAATDATPLPTQTAVSANLHPTQDIIAAPAAGGCPNADCVFPRPTTEQSEPLRLSLPTPGEEPVSAWRPPQYPVPLALGEFDHFYFARPIAADVVNWPIANYRYGGTELSPGITHTGVDIPALAGTPVLAAGPGIVTWAGWGLFSSTPDNIKDPYGIAVSIRHDFGYRGKPLYTIYAHMRAVDVTVGQWVNTGTQIGEVGDTGFTTGPHLHFELRLGQDSYYYTRNPELWLAPPQGWGVLAGRVLSSNREPAHSRTVYIRSLETNHEWTVLTYGPEAVNPDEYYNENMVISDLPAGRYEVRVTFSEKLTDKVELVIKPGRVTYFVYRATYGFTSTDLPPAITPTPNDAP
jgi:murein DD-endopeptidase MepM/ murein hydrolase activator NlpD